MKPSGGYCGKVLRIDLSLKKADIEPLPLELIQNFRGGAGINAAIAYKELKPGVDPLSPDNKVVFGLGPLVGTMTPGSGKGNITTRSPIKPFIGLSGHGAFGMLKFAGFDHLIISGRADKPTVVKIENDQVSFLDAGDLWGKDVFETTDILWDRLGTHFDVTCIGPAGENLVRDASFITNKYAAFARTGVGAIMGSKNLKALAIYGSQGISVADRNRYLKIVKKLFNMLRSDRNLPNWRRYGTLISVETFTRMGVYAAKNYQTAFHEDLLEWFPVEEFVREVKEGDVACLGCPVGCKHHLNSTDSHGNPFRLAVSCMNSVMQSFGTFCFVKGWRDIARCAEVADRMGLDFMGVGNLIAFVMELVQRGILSTQDTDGDPPSWGDAGAVQRWIRKIAYREGLGDTLAKGLDQAAEAIGGEAKHYAMHSKGLGLIYDPRVRLASTEIFSQFTNVRGYASNVSIAMVERTPDQIRRYCKKVGLPDDAINRIVDDSGYNVARLNKWTEDVTSSMEILGLCQFPPYQRIPLDLWAEAYSALTGLEMSRDDLIRAAENMWDVRRAFNMREGATAEHDTCPPRFFEEPVSAGPLKFPPRDQKRFRELVKAYYDERGWDVNTGAPSKEKLQSLGLE